MRTYAAWDGTPNILIPLRFHWNGMCWKDFECICIIRNMVREYFENLSYYTHTLLLEWNNHNSTEILKVLDYILQTSYMGLNILVTYLLHA